MSTILDVKELTSRMVSFDTVSTNSNLPLVKFLHPLLVDIGFEVEIQQRTFEHGTLEKANIIARAGPRDVESFMFSAHTDTVPVGSSNHWDYPPFQLTEEKRRGLLFGRGSVDMKGSIAAMICAIAPLLSKAGSFKRELILGLTYDEEVGLLGAKHLVESKLIRPRYALVGEPTLMRPMRMHKGHIYLRALCRGVSGHASDPQSGINAIEIAAGVIEKLRAFAGELAMQENEEYDPPCATLNIGVIKGGTKANVIAEECAIEFDIRPIKGQTSDLMIQDLVARMRSIGEHGGQPLVSLRLMRCPTEPVTTDANSLIVTVAEQVTGIKARGVPYGTDASVLQLMGTDCLILGPGDIAQAHKPNEFVKTEQLESAVTKFRQIAQKMCL
ncbi:MAG: acetylornithine deacetylase [Patescibacteria group bacterium]